MPSLVNGVFATFVCNTDGLISLNKDMTYDMVTQNPVPNIIFLGELGMSHQYLQV